MMASDVVGALCRCADSLFNATTTDANSALALDAASVLARAAHAAVIDNEPQSVNDVRMASSMADRACADGNLGLAHCLSRALEDELAMDPSFAVGVIMPRVIRFNAPIAGATMDRLAASLGVQDRSDDPEQSAIGVAAALFDLYNKIEFPRFFEPADIDPDLIPAMAMAAGRGLHGEGYLESPPTRQTLIPSTNRRRATIREGEELFERCFA
jgi:alcohol dehydrogenase class IV